MTFRGMAGVCLAVLLGTVVGCSDELANNPNPSSCDRTLSFDITDVPAEVLYNVSASGPAVVHSVTYTLPTGDVTVVNPALPFAEIPTFTVPGPAQIHVIGDVATNGEIAIGYQILPPFSGDDLTVCVG